MALSSSGRSLAMCAATAVTVGSAAWILQKLLHARSKTRTVRIAGIYVYPIKSCRGHSLPRVKLTPLGLKDDRLYMVVDGNNEFVSQRTHPRMALVHPDMPTDAGITLRTIALPESDLKGVSPTQFIPLVKERASASIRQVKIWDDLVPAVDQGDIAAEWLCKFLGAEGLRLVHIAETAHRPTDPNFGSAGETAFADGFPVLVTSQASIDEIKQLTKSKGGPDIGIDRFRTNLHIEGCRPFEEDEIPALSFCNRTICLPLVKPCARCVMPGVDPQNGVRTRATGAALVETLRDLRPGSRLRAAATLHRRHFSKEENSDEVFFGQNAQVLLSHQAHEHFLAVGDHGIVDS